MLRSTRSSPSPYPLVWMIFVALYDVSIDPLVVLNCSAFVVAPHINHRHHTSEHIHHGDCSTNVCLFAGIENHHPTEQFPQQHQFEASHAFTTRRSTVTNGLLFLLPSLLASTATFTWNPQSAYAVATSSVPKKDLKEEYRQGTAALSSEMEDDMAPVPRDAYIKLPSGVIYADVVKPKSSVANNNIVQIGSKVNIQWVLRRSNGYFVDSSQIHDSVPFVFTVGDTNANVPTAIAGLDEGIRGMQVGGVRRLLIPPSLAYVQGVQDGLPGPIPVGYGPRQQIRRIQNIRKDVPGEYIYLEIQLTRLR